MEKTGNIAPSYQADITEEQTSFFRENGFLSIQRITTDREVEWLKEVYNQLFDQRTGEKEGRYFDLGGPGHTRDAMYYRKSLVRKRRFPNSGKRPISGMHTNSPPSCLASKRRA